MIALRIRSDQQGQTHMLEQRQQTRPPQRRAFAARREVGASHCSWKTEPHRRDGDAAPVVERVPVHLQPIAQTIAGRIVPGNARFVHAPARCLSGDQNASLRMHPNDRARRVRQGACAARADLRHQFVERSGHEHVFAYAGAKSLEASAAPLHITESGAAVQLALYRKRTAGITPTSI